MRGAFDLVVPSFYPLTGSIVTVRYKPPRVNPTRGAPSFLNDPVDCNSGILSFVDAVKRIEQKWARATRPPSFLNDPVDCNSGILSSMSAVKRKGKSESGPPGLGKILKRIGLAGVEDAGPIALAGTAAGAVIGCAKDTAPGGSH